MIINNFNNIYKPVNWNNLIYTNNKILLTKQEKFKKFIQNKMNKGFNKKLFWKIIKIRNLNQKYNKNLQY